MAVRHRRRRRLLRWAGQQQRRFSMLPTRRHFAPGRLMALLAMTSRADTKYYPRRFHASGMLGARRLASQKLRLDTCFRALFEVPLFLPAALELTPAYTQRRLSAFQPLVLATISLWFPRYAFPSIAHGHISAARIYARRRQLPGRSFLSRPHTRFLFLTFTFEPAAESIDYWLSLPQYRQRRTATIDAANNFADDCTTHVFLPPSHAPLGQSLEVYKSRLKPRSLSRVRCRLRDHCIPICTPSSPAHCRFSFTTPRGKYLVDGAALNNIQ